MNENKFKDDDLPGLYQSANKASVDAQSDYYLALGSYLILLVVAALVSYQWVRFAFGAITSAALFLVTLGILIWIRVKRPDEIWYNGRAVAESVKTRAWRWIMRAEPYEDCENIELVSRKFIGDLKTILQQNRKISNYLVSDVGTNDPISATMNDIRSRSIVDRLNVYKTARIDDQSTWYATKSQFNKRRAKQWFWVSVSLHVMAIIMLLVRIQYTTVNFPIEVIATCAGAVLTWLQAKKHNELTASYALTAHEIVLIKGEALSIKKEAELSDFVLDSENAFSREHTQWVARRDE